MNLKALTRLTAALLLAGAAPATGQADTIHVPAESGTIQKAIEVALDGDVIMVAPGRYSENLDTLGKEITIQSTDPLDPDVVAATIIEPNTSGIPILSCTANESPKTLIRGLTFTNGLAPAGGAVTLIGASPTITHCRFVANAADGPESEHGGGAVFAEDCESLFESCHFLGNTLSGGGSGGALKSIDGTLTFNDCLFEGNTSATVGGAIDLEHHWNTFNRCTFRQNSAIQGGSMRLFAAVLLNDCHFEQNSAILRGGAIVGFYALIVAENCTFHDNLCEELGGATSCIQTEHCWFVNCHYSGNQALWGGAVGDHSGNIARYIGCTFTGNQASAEGGAVYSYDFSSSQLYNCSFLGNSAGTTGHDVYDTSDMHIANCIIRSAAAESIAGDIEEMTVSNSNVRGGFPGIGNIDGAVFHADADGPDDILGTPDDDLRILKGSAGIDGGDNNFVQRDEADLDNDFDELEPTPLDGAMIRRIIDGDRDGLATVDMGAFEFVPEPDCAAADLDGDGAVNVSDLLELLAAWGQCNTCPADLDFNRIVDTDDLLALLALWGDCE